MFGRPEPLPPELVNACVNEYFDKMYTTVPVVHRGWIQQRAAEVTTSRESYCVVGALCLYILVQLPVQLPLLSKQQANVLALRLYESIKHMRSQTDYSDSPTTDTIHTSFFLSAGLFSLQRQNNAWFHLQEAIIFVKMMRIHNEDAYGTGSPTDVMNRNLFWIVFISERSATCTQHSLI